MREVPLRNRKGEVVAHALVDDEDYEWVNAVRWYRQPSGYVVRNIPRGDGKQTQVSLHRAVMGLGPGDGGIVDHINHDKLDNRKENLRVGTHAQNHQNRRPCGDRGTSSRFRGVSWNKSARKWRAYGCLNGRMHYLGDHTDEEQAAEVARAWREKHMPYANEERG